MKAFAAAQWERARLSLASARTVLETDSDTAASCAYYAAFYAVTAVFALADRGFKKHTAVRAARHRDLIHPGRLPQKVGNDYDDLMDVREEADYGSVTRVSLEDARTAVEKAAGILDAVRGSCPALDEGRPETG